jgi:hypothetical protein
MTKARKDLEAQSKKQKKYMWLGFGDYSGDGLQGPINPGNVRASPGIFDKLFELFGVKEKDKKETEERIR